MMRLYLLSVVFGACGFTPNAATDVQPDAQSMQPTQDAPSMVSRTCHVTDPNLVLCLDFEDPQLDPSVADLSPAHHVADSTDLLPIMRDTQQAANFQSPEAIVHVADGVDLSQTQQVTFETFIELSANSGAWPIDNYDNYGIGLEGSTFFCFARGIYADSSTSLIGPWHHLACAFDGTTLKAYLDGKRVACAMASSLPNAPPQTGTGTGIELGRDFVGQLDDIHIFAAALDEPTIAAHAGATPYADPVNCE